MSVGWFCVPDNSGQVLMPISRVGGTIMVTENIMKSKSQINFTRIVIVLVLIVAVMAIAVGCKGSRASGSTVTGRALRLPGGAPVPFVRILLTGQEDNRLKVTDHGGSYTMLAVPTGTYTISFARFGLPIYTQDLVVDENNETYMIDLPQLATGIEGFGGVVTSIGAPIPNAEVWLVFEDGGLISSTTNLYGEYTLTQLPSGNYDILVLADFYVSELIEDVYIGFEGTRVLDVDLDPVVPYVGGNIFGQVTNEADENLAGAYIGIFPSGTIPSVYMVAVDEALTGPTGYEIAAVPAGTYTVICTASGYYLRSQILIVEAGNPYTLDFELEREN